jgi:hypothetical protein
MTSKTIRAHYTEKEAAQALGVSVEQLRLLIRSHIIECEEDLSNVSAASFQPSDLLLLKILSGQELAPTLGD